MRHVLPNIVAPLIIVFSINVGGVILAEGVAELPRIRAAKKGPDWGGMLSREGRRFMEQAPCWRLWPGLCLTIVVYSFNMLGDAMRDLLDPRLRGGGRLGAGDANLAPQNRRPGAPQESVAIRQDSYARKRDPKRGVERGDAVELIEGEPSDARHAGRSAWVQSTALPYLVAGSWYRLSPGQLLAEVSLADYPTRGIPTGG